MHGRLVGALPMPFSILFGYGLGGGVSTRVSINLIQSARIGSLFSYVLIQMFVAIRTAPEIRSSVRTM